MYSLIKFGSCILMSALLPISFCRAADPTGQSRKSLFAKHYDRKIIYHSPQTPGYTCWVGAWIMPDKSLMVSFVQATGPMKDRPRAPKEIRDANQWLKKELQRDFTGLRLANVYLRSTGGGATWDKVAEAPFASPFDRPVFSQSHIGLLDGTILRAVDGSQLPTTADLPRRVYFQRSPNLGKTWGQPEVTPEPTRPVEFLGDYGDGFSRVRRLRDGRLIALGTVIRDVIRTRGTGYPPGTNEPLMLVSSNEGKTWIPHLFAPEEHRKPGAWNEWDTAELPNGDLLCVVRRMDPGNPSKQVRWQGLLKKKGKTWGLDQYGPSTLVHSGHPELLATREGVILHIATEDIHWTEDAGKTWQPVVFPGLPQRFRPSTAPASLHTRYYPKSVQTADGMIYVFGHDGWDNSYGERDQSIVMDTFRLSTK